jgi:hypothetical protein
MKFHEEIFERAWNVGRACFLPPMRGPKITLLIVRKLA